MPDGLSCICLMPLVWHAVQAETGTRQRLMHDAQIRETTLLLTALNQIEGVHEHEANSEEQRRLERIEAKLDLALHLLARTLRTDSTPAIRQVELTPTGAQWQDPSPPDAGTLLILELSPSELLPLSLTLPAVALEPGAGQARVLFEGLTEALDEALYQFVFRRHRQAIRARTA